MWNFFQLKILKMKGIQIELTIKRDMHHNNDQEIEETLSNFRKQDNQFCWIFFSFFSCLHEYCSN